MTKWKVRAKQGNRVVVQTVTTPEKKRAEAYTIYTLQQRSSLPVEILSTTEVKRGKK
jgi:hypothetical protein